MCSSVPRDSYLDIDMVSPPRRLRLPILIDVAVAAYAAVLVVWANLTFMRPRPAMMQHWDEGYELAFARRMLERGHNLPYVDGVSHRGPLFYWIVALAVKIYGYGTWMPMRTLALVAMLLAVALWFGAACTVRRSLPGAIMALGYFTVCVVGMHLPWEGPAGWGLSFNSEHLVNVFAGAALLSMTLAFPSGKSKARLSCVFACGICVMLSGVSKQIGLLAGLPFGLWALAVALHRGDLPRRTRVRIPLAFGVGLLVPLACVILPFAIAGELHTLYYYGFAYNTQIYIPAIDPGNRDYYVHTIFSLHHDMFLLGACLIGWGASRVFAGAPGHFFRFARVPSVSDIAGAYASNAFEVTVGLGFILSLVGASLGLRDFGHYWLPIVPWSSLLAGLLVDRAIRAIRSRTPERLGRVLWVRASVLSPLLAFATLGWLQKVEDYATDADVRGLFDTQDWPICKFLRARTQPSDPIFIWGFDPAPYTACNRRAASRFVFTTFVSGVVPPLAGGIEPLRSTDPEHVVPGAPQQLLDDLRLEKPVFVFDSYETLRNRSMLEYGPLREFLLSDYCRDLDDGPNVWIRRRGSDCPVRMLPLVTFSRRADPLHSGVDSLTVASDEGKQAASAEGYEIAGEQAGYVFDKPQPGTTALELYEDPHTGDRLTTASPTVERDALAAGYELVRVEGYVFTSPEAGTIPLKLLYDAARGDHLTTASKEEESVALRSGYEFVRIEGYVARW
jgi:hypothetical protein